jgi:hypothetical protein
MHDNNSVACMFDLKPNAIDFTGHAYYYIKQGDSK